MAYTCFVYPPPIANNQGFLALLNFNTVSKRSGDCPPSCLLFRLPVHLIGIYSYACYKVCDRNESLKHRKSLESCNKSCCIHPAPVPVAKDSYNSWNYRKV